MTVLVTGGAGYIGSHVVWALYRAGEKVIVLDNLSTGDKRLLPPDVEFYDIDMTNPGIVFHLCSTRQVTDLIHMAAVTSVPDSVALPMHYIEKNFLDTVSVFENALDAGVKNIVLSSTAAVYGPNSVCPVHENAPTNPDNAYGRSKLMAEWMLDAQSKRFEELKYTVLRYFNVCGADRELHTGQIAGESLFKKAAHSVMTGEPIPVYGMGGALRDFIHVSDIASAHLLALKAMHKNEHFKRSTLNVGYGAPYRVEDVLNMFDRVSGKKIERVKMPKRAGDVLEMWADAKRIQTALGWRPQHHLLETMVSTALEWEIKWRKLNDQR